MSGDMWGGTMVITLRSIVNDVWAPTRGNTNCQQNVGEELVMEKRRPNVGDYVWYWSRRKKEAGKKIYGTLVNTDNGAAFIRIQRGYIIAIEFDRLFVAEEQELT